MLVEPPSAYTKRCRTWVASITRISSGICWILGYKPIYYYYIYIDIVRDAGFQTINVNLLNVSFFLESNKLYTSSGWYILYIIYSESNVQSIIDDFLQNIFYF